MNYYKRHLGDYAKDTKTLTTYEHGVYALLLDFYYSEEGPITSADADDLCRPAGAKEAASVAKVLSRYFKPEGDRWRHNYADKEIAAYRIKAERNREAGKTGGRPRNSGNPNGFQNETDRVSKNNPSHKPLAISQEREESKTRGAPLALPVWLPPAVWEDWHKFRNARKGWTPKARTLSLTKLAKLHGEGHDPQAVVEQSIERGWTGLFPVHADSQPRAGLNPSRQISALAALTGAAHEQADATAAVVHDGDSQFPGHLVRPEPRRLSGG